MNTTFKTTVLSLSAALAVVAAHLAIAGAAASQMNVKADHAMIPVLHAEKIVVTAKRLEVFTADKIVVQARAKSTQIAVLQWNTVV